MREETLERRTFAVSLLDELASEGELTFGELLDTVGSSRATLSHTLVELHTDGLVHKRRLGRRTFYTITSHGARALTEVPAEDRLLDDRITNLVGRRLTESGGWDPQLWVQDVWVRRLRARVVSVINRIQSQGPEGLVIEKENKGEQNAHRRDGRQTRPDGRVR
ncbi:MAG: helix-turn-helix transcriptional regulator [Thermoplasmata archaeon]|nr:MAG: helix-turn-helix transcriptional regulator [Thermoplasmata archaeon]